MTTSFLLMCPLVVAIVLGGLVVVAAGVLVVAFTHVVCNIAETVLYIYIAYEALLLPAMRTGKFTGLMARQFLAL